jgi:hypothetical protein
MVTALLQLPSLSSEAADRTPTVAHTSLCAYMATGGTVPSVTHGCDVTAAPAQQSHPRLGLSREASGLAGMLREANAQLAAALSSFMMKEMSWAEKVEGLQAEIAAVEMAEGEPKTGLLSLWKVRPVHLLAQDGEASNCQMPAPADA